MRIAKFRAREKGDTVPSVEMRVRRKKSEYPGVSRMNTNEKIPTTMAFL